MSEINKTSNPESTACSQEQDTPKKAHYEVSNHRGSSSGKVRYVETNRESGCRLS